MAKPSAAAAARRSADPCQGRVSIDGVPAESAPGSTTSGREEGGPIAAMGELAREPYANPAGAGFRLAGQDRQGRFDEKQETHEPAHRIAGQPKHEGRWAIAPRRSDSEPEGFARLETDLVENTLDPQRVQGRRNEIALAGRDAAGDDQNIRFEPALTRIGPAAPASSGAIGSTVAPRPS